MAWSKFDDLWLSNDLSLPFAIGDAVIHWVPNAVPELDAALGKPIRSVWLGRGQMTWDYRDIEIWARLLLGCGDGFVEVYNALDENGYAFHARMPSGTFLLCAEPPG